MFPEINATFALTAVAILASALIWLLGKRKYNLPPGPVGVPFLGYAPFLSLESYKDFIQLSKKYGDVFSLYLGKSLFVILNDYKSIKEAFNINSFLDRPSEMFSIVPDGIGFGGNNGVEWQEQRRYTMKAMKNIGMGKSKFDEMLEAEVSEVIAYIKTQEGKPFDPFEVISASVSNNITTLVFGKRLEMGHPGRDIVNNGVESAAQAFKPGGLGHFFPALLRIFVKLGLTSYAEYRKKLKEFNSYLKTQAKSRKDTLNKTDDDIYIDGYLTEIKKNEGEKNTFFNEKNLLGNCQALIIGGSETTRTSLLWLLLAMIKHPDVQKKIHGEIDSVLGKDGKCQWADRARLPYTYATIMEGQRWRSVTPLNVAHRTSVDTKFGGYDIPKGTNVIANNWAVHMDPKNWKDPECFTPDRFLLEDGSLMMTRPDNYIPFSIGRRSCPGEFVALIELFHYFQAIMQRFSVHLPDKNTILDLDGQFGTVLQPARQELLFKIRE